MKLNEYLWLINTKSKIFNLEFPNIQIVKKWILYMEFNAMLNYGVFPGNAIDDGPAFLIFSVFMDKG